MITHFLSMRAPDMAPEGADWTHVKAIQPLIDVGFTLIVESFEGL